ncbi:MAG: ATP-dependent chaperone ClpB, partial [Phycisphaerae bacterium]|nr:ATP-dependent chaperone ClpB [Phycisphaerae bacterium]
MQMDRFTTLAQEVLSNAQSLATGRSHGELTPLHILTAMVEDRNGVASSILAKAGLQAERIRDVAEAELGRRPQATGTQPRTANATMEVLQRAEREAKERKDAYVSTEHLLLGLMEVPGDAREVLESCGATRAAIDAAIDGIRKASGVSQVNDADAESNFEALKKYAIDLNERAAAGKIDPVIGRDEEIRRCMQVLSRRTKNNPVLIGEPGVGKTAIAEGLAIRIVDHD